MKSDLQDQSANISEIITRLRIYIAKRICGGEFTERSLARTLRISQPHLHNMLKGIRRMSPAFADRAMLKFGISVLDLIADEEIWSHLDRRKPPGKASQERQQERIDWGRKAG